MQKNWDEDPKAYLAGNGLKNYEIHYFSGFSLFLYKEWQ